MNTQDAIALIRHWDFNAGVGPEPLLDQSVTEFSQVTDFVHRRVGLLEYDCLPARRATSPGTSTIRATHVITNDRRGRRFRAD